MAFTEIDGRSALILEASGSSSPFTEPTSTHSSQSCNAYAYQISIIYATTRPIAKRAKAEPVARVKPCTMLLALYYLFISKCS